MIKRAINLAFFSKMQQQLTQTVFRNENLRFDAQDHHLYVIPRHPNVQRKGATSYAIDSSSIVLTFSFVKKAQTQQEHQRNWLQSVNMYFRFHNIAHLLDVEPCTGKQHQIVNETLSTNTSIKTIYSIIDNSQSKTIQFQLQTEPQHDTFRTSTNYSNFTAIQEIIKESIMDLSGLRLQLDLKRMQALEVVYQSLRNASGKLKDTEQFYKNE